MRDRLGSLAPHLTNEYEWPELERKPRIELHISWVAVLSFFAGLIVLIAALVQVMR